MTALNRLSAARWDLRVRARWAVLHGIPRRALPRRASRGDRMAELLLGYHGEPGGQYAQFDTIRAEGRIIGSEVGAATADHALCRAILRDSRFSTIQHTDYGFPAPMLRVLERTDPGLPNPVEPPSMLVTEPRRTRRTGTPSPGPSPRRRSRSSRTGRSGSPRTCSTNSRRRPPRTW
ncbi:hypothetical protein MTP03_41110 [Tsukamurella sp. PLM1]|nr:hypothetical protein MTP03_41110 [Tsukamurella sp. PLM1]